MKQTLVLGLERDTAKTRSQLLDLLSVWNRSGVLSDSAIRRGFEMVRKGLDDLVPDVPHAPASLKAMSDEAAKVGLPM